MLFDSGRILYFLAMSDAGRTHCPLNRKRAKVLIFAGRLFIQGESFGVALGASKIVSVFNGFCPFGSVVNVLELSESRT